MNSNNKDLRTFDIWFALVPFEEKDGRASDRPVLLFQYKNNDGIWESFKMTKTKPRTNFQGEYRIKYWREAGLECPTTVRLSKVLKVPTSYFRRKVGTLHKEDALEVLKDIRKMYPALQHSREHAERIAQKLPEAKKPSPEHGVKKVDYGKLSVQERAQLRKEQTVVPNLE